jgi:hypothetical protein
MAGKKHASDEIAAKLAQANEMAAKGKNQREISKALGVSVMTYHRWKKLRNPAEFSQSAHGGLDLRPDLSGARGPDAMRQLELENSRLRRLVTDLLLEKVKLEEEIRSRQNARFRRPR